MVGIYVLVTYLQDRPKPFSQECARQTRGSCVVPGSGAELSVAAGCHAPGLGSARDELRGKPSHRGGRRRARAAGEQRVGDKNDDKDGDAKLHQTRSLNAPAAAH